jgi:hypothetical protein
MASDVMSLFNMPTQQQLGQQYLEGMLTSPQQMGAQGLLQQVVSLGGNAGAMLGYGAGRLMGGMTADEVRAKGIDDAMRTVQGLGLTSDAEMYGALSKELANRGLTQDALKARNAGLEARKAEEAIKYQQGRLGIAQEELKISKDRAQREAEKAPVELEALRGQIAERADKLKSYEQKIQENAAIMETAPQDSQEYKEAMAKYLAAARDLEQDRQKQALEMRRVQALEMQAQASLKTAQASQARAIQDAISGKITMPIADITGRVTNVPIGIPVKNGKIMGAGTGKTYTQDEWDSNGMLAEEAAVRKKLMPSTPTPAAPKSEQKGPPTKPLSAFDMSLGTAP